MLDKNGIIKRLMKANSMAKKEIEALKGSANAGLSDFEFHIRNYVIYKFLLDDESGVETNNLNELSALSVEKAGKLNHNEAALLDISRHCGATSSSMTKKVLLFMAISEDFGVDLTKYDTANIETTDMLAKIIFDEKTGIENAEKQTD